MGENESLKKHNRLALGFGRITYALIACVILSQMAGLWWGFELFTHFTWHYMLASGALVIVFLILRRPFYFILSLITFALMFLSVFPFTQSAPHHIVSEADNTPTLTIFQHNLLTANKNKKAAVEWYLNHAYGTDVFVFQEVDKAWEEALAPLKKQYFYQHLTNMGDKNILILSQLLVKSVKVQYFGNKEVVIMQMISSSGKPFTLYALHAPSPVDKLTAETRNAMFDYIANSVKSARYDNSIVVGDFNSTPFSPYFKKMLEKSKLSDSWLSVGYRGTWPAPLPSEIGLSIDHLLISNGLKVVDKVIYNNSLGSDHYPISTTLTFETP